MLDLPIVYLYGLLALDTKTWEKISAEDQAVVIRVMREAFDQMDAQNRLDNEHAFAALENQNIRRLLPTPEQQADWAGRAQSAADNFIQRGGIDPALVKRIREMLQRYRAGR